MKVTKAFAAASAVLPATAQSYGDTPRQRQRTIVAAG